MSNKLMYVFCDKGKRPFVKKSSSEVSINSLVVTMSPFLTRFNLNIQYCTVYIVAQDQLRKFQDIAKFTFQYCISYNYKQFLAFSKNYTKSSFLGWIFAPPLIAKYTRHATVELTAGCWTSKFGKFFPSFFWRAIVCFATLFLLSPILYF